MNRVLASISVLLAVASPAPAAFVPPGASDVVRGKGYVAFSIGGSARVAFPDRSALQHRVAAASRYSAKHGGDLPSNAFWDKVADVYDDDKAAFRDAHRCGPLLRLLRRDEQFDRDRLAPPPVPPLPPPSTPPGPPPRDIPQPPPAGPQPQLPGPPSATLLSIGMAAIVAAGRYLAQSR